MKERAVFTTISYGKDYHWRTRRLAQGLSEAGYEILVYTDDKSAFADMNNVRSFDFFPRKENKGCFSGYDKDRVALRVLEDSEYFWYIDSDWIVKEDRNLDLIENLTMLPGFTSARPPAPSMHSKGYPRECTELAWKKYKIKKVRHHHEFCYAIKKDNGKERDYLKILLELGDIHDNIEMSRLKKEGREIGKGVFISRSSGVSFGFALQASGFADIPAQHKQGPFRQAVYANFSHLAVHSPA